MSRRELRELLMGPFSGCPPQQHPDCSNGTVRTNRVRTEGRKPTNVIDLAYSSDASMLAIATEDKHLRLYGTASPPGEQCTEKGENSNIGLGKGVTELGERTTPKKPTRVLFGHASEEQEVLVVSDKCGDAYAAPLPDPASGLKHLLRHTAMTITSMALLKGGRLLATGDRAEHIRVSQFPRTSIIHTYLLGHEDFVSVLAAVPGRREALLISGAGDGTVCLWDAESGKELCMVDVRQACHELASEDGPQERVGCFSTGDGTSASPEAEEAEKEKESGRRTGTTGGVEVETGGSMASATEEAPCDRPRREGGGVIAEIDKPRVFGATEPGNGHSEGEGNGEADGDGKEEVDLEDGVPISVACSEDGRTAAVVISGLAGLLLLRVSYEAVKGSEGVGDTASLSPIASVQLPAVPIQAGFLGESLIVAAPSPHTCMRSFRCTETPDGGMEVVPEEAKAGTIAARACDVVNLAAKAEALELNVAVPVHDGAEALGGGLRKHRGGKNASKTPNEWNNFSKRRDKKQDKKRSRAWGDPADEASTSGTAPTAAEASGVEDSK